MKIEDIILGKSKEPQDLLEMLKESTAKAVAQEVKLAPSAILLGEDQVAFLPLNDIPLTIWPMILKQLCHDLSRHLKSPIESYILVSESVTSLNEKSKLPPSEQPLDDQIDQVMIAHIFRKKKSRAVMGKILVKPDGSRYIAEWKDGFVTSDMFPMKW
jgi:hypothetical protein